MLTDREIAESQEKRARLERIATAVGVRLDVEDHPLVRALEVLDHTLLTQAKATSKQDAPISLAEAKAMIATSLGRSTQAAQSVEGDLGDQVVARLQQPTRGVPSGPSRSPATEPGDLGDQAVARLQPQAKRASR